MAYKNPDFEALRKQKVQFYLFGEHISKSKAPALHNLLFSKLNLDWNYTQFESSDVDRFSEKFNNEGLIGSAVTMPNKINAIKIVDDLDSVGEGCGSINTIYTRIDPKTNKPVRIGTNTDTVGIAESFKQNYPAETKSYENTPGLVYGGGGACRGAIYALYKLLKVNKIYVINRFKSEIDDLKKSMVENGFDGEIIHLETPEQAQVLEVKPKLIVLTVPNFAPTLPEEIQAKATLDVFKNDTPGVVLEMCYHPVIETQLYNEFIEANWKVMTGIEPMIYQAVAQQILWTGYKVEEIPVKETVKILYEQIKKEQAELK